MTRRNRRSSRASRPKPRGPSRTSRTSRPASRSGGSGARWFKVLGALVLLAAALVSALLIWSLVPGSAPKDAPAVVVHLEDGSKGRAVEQLSGAGLVESPWLMKVYLSVLLPTVELAPGEHLLRRGLSPRELSARVARLPRRGTARVALPEGWHRRRMAQRLEKAEVCRAGAFLAATESPELLEKLGIEGPSAEGYLFPATYDLGFNTPAEEIVLRMVKETRKRLQPLLTKHSAGLERLENTYGFGEGDLLTLASIIEKETAHGSERPLIASVFLNRLAQKDGETRGRLQSDPTAAYGCEYEGARAASCSAFDGRVQPNMLRDADNRYNTYRHAGLPPGPIANPGLSAMEAVLAPADSDYLFFVADGAGNHSFSRSFEEHQLAVARLRTLRAAGPSVSPE